MSHNVDIKVVLLGKEFGGKTSLVERYLHDRFSGDIPYQNTIGAAFGAKKVTVNGRTVSLGIWDTAGSERYEAMSRIYYRGAGAAIVCYDLTDKTSFERAEFWFSEIRSYEEACRIYLCGTKKDMIVANLATREVDYHMATDYGDLFNAPVFETSSKSGENVVELFHKIAEDYCKSNKIKEKKNVNLESEKKSTRKWNCCQS